VKLLKFIEGKRKIKSLTLEEAQFYYGTLNVRLHKSMKWLNLEDEQAVLEELQRNN